MEQTPLRTDRLRRGAVGCNGIGIGCTVCCYYIGVGGDCNCSEAFALSDLDQKQRDGYTAQFCDLIRYMIRTGVPRLSPSDNNYYELQRVSGMSFKYDGIVYTSTYNVNGVNVHLDQQHFKFMEPQAGESSNSNANEEVHKLASDWYNSRQELNKELNNAFPSITKYLDFQTIPKSIIQKDCESSCINEKNNLEGELSNNLEGQELNNTSLSITKHVDFQNIIQTSCESACAMEVHANEKNNLECKPALFLRLTLTRILHYHCILILDILGENLDWQQILQGMESNTLQLKWKFYKTVAADTEDDNIEENDEGLDQHSEEELCMSEDEESDSFQEYDDEETELFHEFEDEDDGPSAIENLATRVICYDQVVSGDAICSICRDMIAMDEEVKELPCKHLYHSECITQWLSIRNFCPLCKYNMPTDEQSYSEVQGLGE